MDLKQGFNDNEGAEHNKSVGKSRLEASRQQGQESRRQAEWLIKKQKEVDNR